MVDTRVGLKKGWGDDDTDGGGESIVLSEAKEESEENEGVVYEVEDIVAVCNQEEEGGQGGRQGSGCPVQREAGRAADDDPDLPTGGSEGAGAGVSWTELPGEPCGPGCRKSG